MSLQSKVKDVSKNYDEWWPDDLVNMICESVLSPSFIRGDCSRKIIMTTSHHDGNINSLWPGHIIGYFYLH